MAMFFLFIGGTELATVPGLSAAGACAEIAPYTAPADADLIRFGRSLVTTHLPVDPEGHPTPAIITLASLELGHIPCCVLRAGSYIPPSPPYVELSGAFGRDPSRETAVPDAQKIYAAARGYAEANCAHLRSVTIAESVPGGTTTALLLLRALGYEGMVSSAGPVNPTSIKERVWAETAARLGTGIGGFKGRAMEAVRELGDPMQAAVIGFAEGLPKTTEIILAGGTQMLAIAAALRDRDKDMRPIVSTTPYVGRDQSSSFRKYAEEIGVETYIPALDFSKSRHKGLSDYELGYVKEGVGAGGAVMTAEREGVSIEAIQRRTEEIYEKMMSIGDQRNQDFYKRDGRA